MSSAPSGSSPRAPSTRRAPRSRRWDGRSQSAKLSPKARRAADRGLSELDDALGPDAYWRQRTWKRLAVIAAGPGVNLVFAIVLLAAVYMLGIPTDASRRVQDVIPKSPAAVAGLHAGDRIVGVNRVPAYDFTDVRDAIRDSKGKALVISVVRHGRYVELPAVKPTKTDGVYTLGFHPAAIRYTHYSPPKAVALAAEDTWLVTKAMGTWSSHIANGSGRKDVSTPVGIVQQSSKAVDLGYREYLQVLAIISLSLALLNLLPLLPLDGGHMLFSIVEGIRGRAIQRSVYERVSAVGIALVLLLFFVGPLERHRKYPRGLDSARGERTLNPRRRRPDRRRRAGRRAVDDADEDARRRGHDRRRSPRSPRPAARSCAWRCRRARTRTRCRRSSGSRRCR